MLQWMGGSRRKVTTSRNGTHKRQRQYFEQRKRQQQMAGLESHVDGKPSCSQYCENNRSLDILSLANVSSVVREHETSCLNARDDSDDNYDGFALNHQYAYHSPSSRTGVDTVVLNQSGQRDERALTSHCSDTGNPKKFLVRLSDPNEDVTGSNKHDHLKFSPAQQMSIMDLLGDGGVNSSSKETSVREQEAHVAFSIEGLGKVEAETPARSPKTPGRFFPKGYSSSKNSWKHCRASKHSDYGLDDLEFQDVMMPDSRLSPYASSTKYQFCSPDAVNIIGRPNQVLLNLTDSSPFDWSGSSLKGVFSEDEHFSRGQESGGIIWNGSSFLDDNNADDLGAYGLFCKSWDGPSDDHFKREDHWIKEFNFDNWNLLNKRFSTRLAESFDMAEASLPHQKFKILEDGPDFNGPDFNISDTRCTTTGIDDEVKDASACFEREETREMSRLSEESCSSTAVREMQPRNLEKTNLE